MAQIHKLEVETQVKCSADKFYGMFKHNVTQLPNYLPQVYDSIKVIEGDGASLSSVRLWKYAPVEGKFWTCKEKSTFDNKTRSITMNVIEGDTMNDLYKSFDTKLAVTPKGDGSSVKWTLEYEKADEDVPSPIAIINMLERVTKDLSSQLLKR